MKTQALKNCCEVLHEEEKVQKRQRTNLSEDSSKGAEFTQYFLLFFYFFKKIELIFFPSFQG